ncbi:MAG: hemolysin family protein [Arachnia sp.]
MTPVVALIVGIVVVLGITAFTGYFVAQEFAYVAVDRAKLRGRAADGDARAEATLQITTRTSFMLSGAQLGITVTGLLVGYVAEPLIGQSLSVLFTGGHSTAVSVGIGGFVALAFSTVIQMLFGELFPKNYAIARSTEVAAALTPSTRIYLTIFGPIIWVFDKAAELLLRTLKIEPVHDVEDAATVTDLERVVEISRENGTLPTELSVIIDRIIDFPRQDVEHAMRPRVRVDTVRATDTVAVVRARMAAGHTRYPVLDEGEAVVGVVHLVDVLDADLRCTEPVTAIMRDALLLPEFMPLTDAHDRLLDRDLELACVVDEFGDFVGIITQEDMAEEIVGELTDEHDPAEPDYVPRPDDGIWVMDGEVHVDEVERALLIDLPPGDHETIAGLIIATVGDLPPEGTVVDIPLVEDAADQVLSHGEHAPHLLRAEVLAIDKHVPSRVRLTLPEAPAASEADL